VVLAEVPQDSGSFRVQCYLLLMTGQQMFIVCKGEVVEPVTYVIPLFSSVAYLGVFSHHARFCLLEADARLLGIQLWNGFFPDELAESACRQGAFDVERNYFVNHRRKIGGRGLLMFARFANACLLAMETLARLMMKNVLSSSLRNVSKRNANGKVSKVWS